MSKNYQEDLSHIRSMMERSTRFISLSGLSGVVAGLVGLLASVYVYFMFQNEGIDYFDGERNNYSPELIKKLCIVALVTLLLAVLSGYFFTAEKSKRNQSKMWDPITKRLLFNFAVPLFTGGVFCLALLYHNAFPFIAPSMLVFYGLGLINCEKYTLTDVKSLGYCEVALGLVSLFFLGWGLVFWGIGFGILHIVYGIMMYKKYDLELKN